MKIELLESRHLLNCDGAKLAPDGQESSTEASGLATMLDPLNSLGQPDDGIEVMLIHLEENSESVDTEANTSISVVWNEMIKLNSRTHHFLKYPSYATSVFKEAFVNQDENAHMYEYLGGMLLAAPALGLVLIGSLKLKDTEFASFLRTETVKNVVGVAGWVAMFGMASLYVFGPSTNDPEDAKQLSGEYTLGDYVYHGFISGYILWQAAFFVAVYSNPSLNAIFAINNR